MRRAVVAVGTLTGIALLAVFSGCANSSSGWVRVKAVKPQLGIEHKDNRARTDSLKAMEHSSADIAKQVNWLYPEAEGDGSGTGS